MALKETMKHKCKLMIVERCGLKTDPKTNLQKLTTDGKPIYVLATSADEIIKIGNKEFSNSSIEKIDSLLELENGQYECEFEQYAVANERTHKVSLFYRLVAATPVSQAKKA